VLSVGDSTRVAEAVFKMIEHFLGSYPLDSVITQIATQTTAAAAASRASGSGGDSRRSLDEASELGTRLQRAMSAAGQLYRQAVEAKREFSSFIVTYLDLLLEKVVRPSLEQMTRGFITVLPVGDDEFHHYVRAYCHTEHDLRIVAHGPNRDTEFAVALTVRETIYILDSGEWAADVLVDAVSYVDVEALYEHWEENLREQMVEEGEDMRDTNVLERLLESVAEGVDHDMYEHYRSSPRDSVFITGSPRDDAARVAEVLVRLTLNKNMDVLEDLGVQRVDAEAEFDLP
jgi:hypothetical protein